MVNFEKVHSNFEEESRKLMIWKSSDGPRNMHFLNFIKSGNICYATFYGKRWVMMEVIFGWFTLRTEQPLLFPQIAKTIVPHARMCPNRPYEIIY